jgi:hypothetical protein
MAYTQTQKETGINQYLGKSIAIDGYYSVSADNSGNGYLYSRDLEGRWNSSTIVCSGASLSFGDAVSIYGDYFVIGEPSYNAYNGRVAIYSVRNTHVPLQVIDGISAGGQFGSSVFINNSYIVVGAPYTSSNSGEVFIYVKNDDDTWTVYSGNPIVPEILSTNDYFGCSVGLYQNTCAIGARGDSNATGAIYLFEKNSITNEWEESTRLLSSDGKYNDQFGGSLSISDGYLAGGAKFWDSPTGDSWAGAVYIFKQASSWYEVDKLTGVDESSYENNKFGSSVSLKGDYLIIGSPEARNKGVVDIFYKKRGWEHLIKLIADDIDTADGFGYSVDISGPHVAIGSNLEGGGDNGVVGVR